MNRASKEKLVVNYSKLFSDHESIFLIRNSGLSVFDSKSIRSQFKKIDSKFMITKNSLAKIALKETKFSSALELFSGPIAVAYSNDPVSASKVLIKFCEQNDNIDVIGGAILDKQLDKNQVIELSKLPTKDEIRAKVVGLVNAAASKLVRVINEPGAKLARITKAYANKQ